MQSRDLNPNRHPACQGLQRGACRWGMGDNAWFGKKSLSACVLEGGENFRLLKEGDGGILCQSLLQRRTGVRVTTLCAFLRRKLSSFHTEHRGYLRSCSEIALQGKQELCGFSRAAKLHAGIWGPLETSLGPASLGSSHNMSFEQEWLLSLCFWLTVPVCCAVKYGNSGRQWLRWVLERPRKDQSTCVTHGV